MVRQPRVTLSLHCTQAWLYFPVKLHSVRHQVAEGRTNG